MMNVLLTGARGQVGHEIIRTTPSDIKLFSFDKKMLDITSVENIQNVFAEYKPDYVINAAAYTAVDNAEKEPELAYAINAMGALHVADECRKANIPLIHLSTDYVFDGCTTTPYLETDKASPLSVYGKSKWEGEQTIRETWFKHIILRTSWVFGCNGNNFVKTMLRLAREQLTVRVVSDQHGCPTAAYDIALVIWQIMKCIHQQPNKNFWGTYHFANQQETSWYEFAKQVISVGRQYRSLVTEHVTPIMSVDYPGLAVRPGYSVLNCKKISDYFQINPRHWMESLDEVIMSLSALSVKQELVLNGI